MARTLRVMQTLRFFFKLRMLINTLLASFMALFWSIVLLCVVMLMASLFVCQGLSDVYDDDSIALADRQWVFRHYGTPLRSTYTMFELTFSGGWPNYARRLVEKVSPAWSIFFLVYVFAVIFAMFRIITALFLRDALAVAAQDQEAALIAEEAKRKNVAGKLAAVFKRADTSGDGMLTFDEFDLLLGNPQVKTMLSLLEIHVSEAEDIFRLLENENGEVSDSDFVKGMMRIKGQPKSQDVLAIVSQNRKLMAEVHRVQTSCDTINQSLTQMVFKSVV